MYVLRSSGLNITYEEMDDKNNGNVYICWTNARRMLETCRKRAGHMHETYPKHARNMPQRMHDICPKSMDISPNPSESTEGYANR